MFKPILSTAALLCVSLQVSAQSLDKSEINYLGSIANNAQFKPFESSRHNATLDNFAVKLQQEGEQIEIFGEKLKWQSLDTVKGLTIPGLQALKFTINATRFSEGKLSFKGIKKGTLYLDGVRQSLTEQSYALKLVTGQHQVLYIAEQVSDWGKVDIDFKASNEHDAITITADAISTLKAKQLFDSPTIRKVSLSPNAKQLIVTKRHYADKSQNQAQQLTELKDTNNMQTRYAWQTPITNIAWSKDNDTLVYTSQDALWSLNRDTLERTKLSDHLSGISNLAFYDDNTLIFAWTKSAEQDKGITKHYRGLEDRWSYARNVTHIFMLDVPSGMLRQVSNPKHSYTLLDFDHQRERILLSRSIQDYQAPPHMLTELLEYNLLDNTETTIGQYRTFSNAQYASDGLYITAGPSFNQHSGANISAKLSVNDYDTQLYRLSYDGKKATPLSKQFKPAIGNMQVLENDDVLINVTEQDTKQLYLFDQSKTRFDKIITKLDVVESFSLSNNKHLAVTGSNASAPQKLILKKKLSSKKVKTLWDSKPLAYANTQIATLEEFDFKNQDDITIRGRVYLPSNLDKSKKYPALVYYYGGTAPVSRAFTGRYPFNFWAANGYVVYVLQPTGTTGFGQDFSGKHVNAWGQYTANDIIQGTEAFLAHYPFVDKNKVGNLGASYGGFMTMLLATKTDLFSASIAHAGISNITSYWGQGWWGYLYSGIASKGSFPWNNPTLYSQHSPVFHADKVTTPLLLIHGDADTNVPVGESHTMYTALKLLGKDVELVEYKGENHTINGREQRLDWWNTMIAYFDKHLKQQPQWWNSLYPEQK